MFARSGRVPTAQRAVVVVAAALGASLVELTLIALRQPGAPPRAMAMLGLGTFALSALLAAILGALLLAMERALDARSRWLRVSATDARRRGVGLAALAVAVALHVVNATVLVRLYLSIHVALTLGSLALALVGWALLLGTESIEAALRARSTVIVGVVAALGFGSGFALVRVNGDPALRASAFERTTTLSQTMLLTAGAKPAPLLAPGAPASSAVDVTALAAAPLGPVTGVAPRANVVLLVVDAMRADRFPGARRAEALPTMAALGAEGVRFERAYAPSCWTMHSVYAELTSRWPTDVTFARLTLDETYAIHRLKEPEPLLANPFESRSAQAPLDDRTPTLAGLLRDAGYQTFTVVPYALYLKPMGVTREFEVVDEAEFRRLHRPSMGDIAPVPMAERALEQLGRRDPSKPFLLFLHFMEAHAPYQAHDEASRGAGDEARYGSELRHVDGQLRVLLDGLGRLGVLDQSLIVLQSDHGEEFLDHGGKYHATTLFEEQVRVPLVFRLPASARRGQGSRVEAAVSTLDVVPTLLDLLAVRSEVPFRGRSLASAVLGGSAPARPIPLQCDRFGRTKRGLVDWPYKVIADPLARTVQLYHLERDPDERNNLAPTETARAEAMIQAMGSAGVLGP